MAFGEPSLGLIPARNLAATVAGRIVDAIAWGELEPGQRLVEAELAARLGISRVPLREAIKTLEAQGILTVLPHRGTHVAAFGESWAARVRRARIALERLAFLDAGRALRHDPRQVDRLDRLILAMEQDAAGGDFLGVIRSDLAFHRSVVDISGDDLVATLWEALARHVLIVFGREVRAHHPILRHGEEHRELRDLLLAGDPEALEIGLERHIERVPRLTSADESSSQPPREGTTP
jgi:DNA-binding GntR family transcriptional regulator